VIRLTRLNNQQIALNSDLIKFVESKPVTVITLINGEKLVVHESVDDVLARIIEFRCTLIFGLSSLVAGPTEALLATTNVQQAGANAYPLGEGHSRG